MLINSSTVLLVEGHLQVTGIDQISVSIRTTKDATITCRLNDREPVECKQMQDYIHKFI